VTGSEIAGRLRTVENELASNLSAVIYLLNVSEVMTSQATVESRRVMTSVLLDQLSRLRRNATRARDVTQDTRTRAHHFRVSRLHTVSREKTYQSESDSDSVKSEMSTFFYCLKMGFSHNAFVF